MDCCQSNIKLHTVHTCMYVHMYICIIVAYLSLSSAMIVSGQKECLNGGNCYNGVCNCSVGFYGEHCEKSKFFQKYVCIVLCW